MKNIHLTENKCNICGSETKYLEISNKHVVTGEYKEKRVYECNKTVIYYPNFRNIEITKLCNQSKEYKEFENKREEAKVKVRNYINKLDVDDEWKNTLLKQCWIIQE